MSRDRSAPWSAATDPSAGAHPRCKTPSVPCFIRSIRPIRGSARSRLLGARHPQPGTPSLPQPLRVLWCCGGAVGCGAVGCGLSASVWKLPAPRGQPRRGRRADGSRQPRRTQPVRRSPKPSGQGLPALRRQSRRGRRADGPRQPRRAQPVRRSPEPGGQELPALRGQSRLGLWPVSHGLSAKRSPPPASRQAPRQATDGSDESDAEHRVPRTVGVSVRSASRSAATHLSGGLRPRCRTSSVPCFIRSIRPIRGSARSRLRRSTVSSATSAVCFVDSEIPPKRIGGPCGFSALSPNGPRLKVVPWFLLSRGTPRRLSGGG